jgi:hypothetical protein
MKCLPTTLFLALVSSASFCACAQTPAPTPQGINTLQRQEDDLNKHLAETDQKSQETDKKIEETSKKTDTTEKEITHLEQEMMIMLGVSTLVIAILLGSIVFGEYRISQAVSDLRKRAEEEEKRFPRYAELEKRIGALGKEIEELFHDDNWNDGLYVGLDVPLRQNILSADPLIALEFAGSASARQFRGMANFYFSKYSTEKITADLDRALYYALRADVRGDYKFQYKNDLGLIYLELAESRPAFFNKAEETFKDSKRKRPGQKRCYYDLGYLYIAKAIIERARHDVQAETAFLNQAKTELEIGLVQKDWETAPNSSLATVLNYNYACVLSRLAMINNIDATQKSATYDEVVRQLKIVSGYAEIKIQTLEGDLNQDGDFYELSQSPVYKNDLSTIHTGFTDAWSKKKI